MTELSLHPNLILLYNLLFWQMHDTHATMISLMPTADITSQSQCSFPLSLERSTESVHKHYSRQPLLVKSPKHSMSYLLAAPVIPPSDEYHHLNSYSEKIVNSTCCMMNATLRRPFGKSQKWNSSEMWWFRGYSPTATYKETEDTMWRARGSLPPSQLWSHHFQSLDAAVMVCCFPQKENCTLLQPTRRLKTPPPLWGVRFHSQIACSQGLMTGWKLRVPSDCDMVQIKESNRAFLWLPCPESPVGSPLCVPSSPRYPPTLNPHIMMLFFFPFLGGRI